MSLEILDQLEEKIKQAVETIQLLQLEVEELKEQLEVAKQNLDLTKKNAELQNTLKERDTRILVGDRWVNVADPEKLYNAQLESTKAQLSLDNLVQSNVENEQLKNEHRNWQEHIRSLLGKFDNV